MEDGQAYLSMIAHDNPTNVFAIEVNGEAAGSIGIYSQPDIHERSAEIGYWLAEEYSGQGIDDNSHPRDCQVRFSNI